MSGKVPFNEIHVRMHDGDVVATIASISEDVTITLNKRTFLLVCDNVIRTCGRLDLHSKDTEVMQQVLKWICGESKWLILITKIRFHYSDLEKGT